MRKRVILLLVIPMLVFWHFPIPYVEPEEIPAYMLSWSAVIHVDDYFERWDSCYTTKCSEIGGGSWSGSAVYGCNGNRLSFDRSVKYGSGSSMNTTSHSPCDPYSASCGHSVQFEDLESALYSAAGIASCGPKCFTVSSGNNYATGSGTDCYDVETPLTLSEGLWRRAFGGIPPAGYGEICLSPSEASSSKEGHWEHVIGRGGFELCQISGAQINDIGTYVDWKLTLERLSPCPPSLVVTAVEVTQAIQNWSNSVPLVEGKSTYVRAFITTCPEESGAKIPVKVQLRAYRGGVELAGSPLQPENRLSSPYAWRESNNETIFTDARKQLNSSINFRLPKSWTKGTIKLVLERLDGQFSQNGGKAFVEPVVEFEPVAKPEVQFFAVDWTDSWGNTWKLSVADIKKLKKRLVAIYPVRALEFIPIRRLNFGTMPADGPYGKDAVKQHKDLLFMLMLQRELDGCTLEKGCKRIYYGALPEGSKKWGGRAEGIPSYVSYGTMVAQDSTWEHNDHAHEIGHNLGLHHSVDGVLFGTDNNFYQWGACCERAAPWAQPFEYFSPDVLNVDPAPKCAGGGIYATSLRAFISDPIYTYPTVVYRSYGLNTHSLQAVDPEKHFELMSYCGRGGNNWQWISDMTYISLMDSINNTFGAMSIASLGAEGSADYFLVPGTVNLTTGEVILRPFSKVTRDIVPTLPPPGDYSLVALDASQNVISRLDFQPRIPEDDFPMGGSSNYAIFLLTIPADPQINKIKIVHNNITLATKSKSQHEPSVNILFPQAGSSLDNRTEVVSWTADDADGDSLSYTIQYSADGGSTWETLGVDWPEKTYELNMAYITGTTTGRIRVLASDGFNVGTGESEGYFLVPNHKPTADIAWPQDDAVFAGEQQISLEGSGTDREDGLLPGTSLSWQSDVDGVLGTGGNLLLTANELTEGNHVITLTVTDSEGLSGSESIAIRIVHNVPPGLADLVVSINGPAEPIKINTQVTYDIAIHNDGPDDATGIIVTDTIDDTVSFVSATSSQGSCVEQTGKVKCSLGDLHSSADATVTIAVIHSKEGMTNYYISAYGDQVDPMLDNNETTYQMTTITPYSAVTLITPTGGENIPAGSLYNIQWGAPDNATKFKLKYSINNGLTWTAIAPGFLTGTSYQWQVPIFTKNKLKCLVKVIGFNDTGQKFGLDISDTPFAIEIVKLTYPNRGETLTSGEQPVITWTTSKDLPGVDHIVLSYTLDNGLTWKNIDTTSDNSDDGSFQWTVPSVVKKKPACRAKIVLKGASGKTLGSDMSDKVFTIQPAP